VLKALAVQALRDSFSAKSAFCSPAVLGIGSELIFTTHLLVVPSAQTDHRTALCCRSLSLG